MMARIMRPGPWRRPVRTSSGGLSRTEVKDGSSAGGRAAREGVCVKGRRKIDGVWELEGREGRRMAWLHREGAGEV